MLVRKSRPQAQLCHLLDVELISLDTSFSGRIAVEAASDLLDFVLDVK
jgi:hypothetical protein